SAANAGRRMGVGRVVPSTFHGRPVFTAHKTGTGAHDSRARVPKNGEQRMTLVPFEFSAPTSKVYCVLATIKSTAGAGSCGPTGKCPSPDFTMTVIWPPNSL